MHPSTSFIFDHAFASGQVYLKPQGLFSAWRLTRSFSAARHLRAVWHQFENNATIGNKVRLSLKARLINKAGASSATIGDEVALRAILRVEPGGWIDIGAFCYIGDGVIVSAANRLRIGAATLIAHGAQIFDNDTHPIDPLDREAHFKKMLGYRPERPLSIGSAPVSIGSRCWIGMNSIVMKGVTIGHNSIVAPGSVVIKDVPDNVLVAGNPSTVIKNIKPQLRAT